MDNVVIDYDVMKTSSSSEVVRAHAPDSGQPTENQQPDLIREYSLCLLRLLFILADLKRAVQIGDGDRLASLHKGTVKALQK